MLDVLIDALLDSLIVLGIIFILYIIISFIEDKLANLLTKKNHLSPLFGSLVGSVPQCGFVVVSSDMYLKRHITMGTLIAVFISCSDEALPIILSHADKALMVLPLLFSKILLGTLIGIIIDIINQRDFKEVHEHIEHCDLENTEIHTGCCKHEIGGNKENKWHKHLLHPLIHSIKIFAYILAVNIIFGTIVYFVGEENITHFLQSSKYLSPLFATIVGIIPNCSASVIITELYVNGGIGFGACLGGLCMNAGLGFLILFKNKENLKNNLQILSIIFITSVIVGYLFSILSWTY